MNEVDIWEGMPKNMVSRTRARIEPLDTWVKLVVDEALSPEARSAAIADFARASIADVRKANRNTLGRETPETVYVDGKKGAALNTVNPDRGIIVAEFDLMQDVLSWIWTRLRESSPVRSGDYREGHKLFADGAEVGVGDGVPEAEEYAFTNTVPYARKIEVGKTKAGRAFVIQVEPKIYERVAKEARGKFGNLAEIGFTFRGIVAGAQINQAKAASSGASWWLGHSGEKRAASGALETKIGKRHGQYTHNRSNLRYPTITIRLR